MPAKKILAIPSLDTNPAIRKALEGRLVQLAQTTPVVLLHQIVQMLELYKQENSEDAREQR